MRTRNKMITFSGSLTVYLVSRKVLVGQFVQEKRTVYDWLSKVSVVRMGTNSNILSQATYHVHVTYHRTTDLVVRRCLPEVA